MTFLGTETCKQPSGARRAQRGGSFERRWRTAAVAAPEASARALWRRDDLATCERIAALRTVCEERAQLVSGLAVEVLHRACFSPLEEMSDAAVAIVAEMISDDAVETPARSSRFQIVFPTSVPWLAFSPRVDLVHLADHASIDREGVVGLFSARPEPPPDGCSISAVSPLHFPRVRQRSGAKPISAVSPTFLLRLVGSSITAPPAGGAAELFGFVPGRPCQICSWIGC